MIINIRVYIKQHYFAGNAQSSKLGVIINLRCMIVSMVRSKSFKGPSRCCEKVGAYTSGYGQ